MYSTLMFLFSFSKTLKDLCFVVFFVVSKTTFDLFFDNKRTINLIYNAM